MEHKIFLFLPAPSQGEVSQPAKATAAPAGLLHALGQTTATSATTQSPVLAPSHLLCLQVKGETKLQEGFPNFAAGLMLASNLISSAK